MVQAYVFTRYGIKTIERTIQDAPEGNLEQRLKQVFETIFEYNTEQITVFEKKNNTLKIAIYPKELPEQYYCIWWNVKEKCIDKLGVYRRTTNENVPFTLGKCEVCKQTVFNNENPEVHIGLVWRARYWEDRIVCTMCAEEELAKEGRKAEGQEVVQAVMNRY